MACDSSKLGLIGFVLGLFFLACFGSNFRKSFLCKG